MKNQFIVTLLVFLGIFNQKRGTLLDKVDEPSCRLNLLLPQINSASLPEQKAANTTAY